MFIKGIHHHPVTTTFAMFEYQSGDTLTVLDPNRIEEEAMLVNTRIVRTKERGKYKEY